MSTTALRPLSSVAAISDFLAPVSAAGKGARLEDASAHPDNSRFTRRFVMTAPLGFHMRPATLFVKTAQLYDASVMVGKPHGDFTNGKSIMGLLTLELLCGEEVVVSVHGYDAAEAMSAIARLFADAFGQRNADANAGANFTATDAPFVS